MYYSPDYRYWYTYELYEELRQLRYLTYSHWYNCDCDWCLDLDEVEYELDFR